MSYKRLFIWVEGSDDKRFFDKIIKPRLQKKYNLIEVRPHAGLKNEKIDSFLRSIKAMGADYIFAIDINNAPCITAKKQEIKNKIRNINENRIIVVIKEIESWYLAGLTSPISKKFKIHTFKTTKDITKEQFNYLIPKKFDSRIDFMLEILKFFSIKNAVNKNNSFKYFIKKYNC